MKRIRIIVAMLLILAVCAFLFAACKEGDLPADGAREDLLASDSAVTEEIAPSTETKDAEGATDSDETSDAGATTENTTSDAGSSAGDGQQGGAVVAEDLTLPASTSLMLASLDYEPTIVDSDGEYSIEIPNFSFTSERVFSRGDDTVTETERFLFKENGIYYEKYEEVQGMKTPQGSIYLEKDRGEWFAYMPLGDELGWYLFHLSGETLADSMPEYHTVLLEQLSGEVSDGENFRKNGDHYDYIGPELRFSVEADSGEKEIVTIDGLVVLENGVEIRGKVSIESAEGEEAETEYEYSYTLFDFDATAFTYPRPINAQVKAQIFNRVDTVPTEDVEAVEKYIEEHLESWGESTKTERYADRTSLLKGALGEIRSDCILTGGEGVTFAPNFSVNFDAEKGIYTVLASWDGGLLEKTFTVSPQFVTYPYWAGEDSSAEGYTTLTSKVSETVDKMAVAYAKSVYEAISKLSEGKCGISWELGLDLFGLRCTLEIKGNADFAAPEKNELAFLLLGEEGGKLLAVYYDGAAVYFEYPTEEGFAYRYTDDPELLEIFETPLSAEEGEEELIVGTDVGGGEIRGLADLLPGGDPVMQMIVPVMIDGAGKAYVKDGRYLVDIDMDELITYLRGLLAGMGTQTPYLDKYGIDLLGMHGFFGHLSLSAVMEEEGISDVEIAFNVPESIFYLGADEGAEAKSIAIPAVSLAIRFDAFDFLTEEGVENVIPDEVIAGAVYFDGADEEAADAVMDEMLAYLLSTDGIEPFARFAVQALHS